MNAPFTHLVGERELLAAANVLLQVTLVTALALVAARVARRVPAVRHRLLLVALSLVLVSPAVAAIAVCSKVNSPVLALFTSPPAPTAATADRTALNSPPTIAAPGFVDAATESVANANQADRSEGASHVPSASDQQLSQVAVNEEASAATIASRFWSALRAAAPALVVMWLAGVLVLLVRTAIGWQKLRVMLRAATPVGDAAVARAFVSVVRSLNAARSPELVESKHARGPFSAGLRRARVVLPTGLIDQVSMQELRNILIHEVAHVVRRDQAIVWLQNLAAAVFWPHPLVAALNRNLARTREQLCDNYVLAASDGPSYSRTLLTLTQFIRPAPWLPGTVGLFASRRSLERRIGELLDERRSGEVRPSWRGATIAAVLSLTMTAIASLGAIALAGGEARTDEATQDEATPKAATKSPIVRGTITLPDGKPAAGALVAAFGHRLAVVDDYRRDVLSDGVADEAGRFELVLKGATAGTHDDAMLISRTADSALAWQSLDLNKAETQLEIRLRPAEIVRFRLVDGEGQPAEGLTATINYIMPTVGKGDPFGGISLEGFETQPQAAPVPLSTDDQGLLVIPHLALDHGILLEIAGTDRFAIQHLVLNSGHPEERGPNDGTYRSLVKNAKPGETPTLALAPARIFSGVVRFDDTGLPAADARLLLYASDQEELGSSVAVEGRTDAEGRFRLNPYPGVRYTITAFSPHGAPYHTRFLDLKWGSGPASQNVEVRLERGVLAAGVVVDAQTGEPLAGAAIQYFVDVVHNTHVPRAFADGWPTQQRTDAEGRFALTILPGPGTLLVHAAERKYVLQTRGSGDVRRGEPGGSRMYAHAFYQLDPPADGMLDPLRIELTPGASVTATIEDAQGNPVDNGLVISTLRPSAAFPEWQGRADDFSGGQFEFQGLVAGKEYSVHLLDPVRQIGATAKISTDDPAPKIVLEPCGSAKATYVGKDGKPAGKGRQYGLWIVVTPGPPRSNFAAGELSADEDFTSNFDRRNHWDLATNDQGEIEFPALIPGATYRVYKMVDGRTVVAKEFIARSGEHVDLGKFEVDVGE